MKQQTAQKISQAIHDWRDAESVSLCEFPFKEADVSFPKSNHIGLRIGIAAIIRTDSLVMKLCELANALESIAFENENFIDYIEILRVKADEEETITVEVTERTDKRKTWVNE